MKPARVAAHVHSAWSYDAHWSLEDIARAFRKRRYDAVLMSEHDRSFDEGRWEEYQEACRRASSSDLVLIPGIEYEDADGVVHTPVWGTDVPFLGAALPTLDVLRAAREHDAVAVFAHPGRQNAIESYRDEWASLLAGVEIWNRKYDGVAASRQAKELADMAGLKPFVTLDFHTRRQFFPLAMSVQLTEPPSTTSLVAAIRSGRCSPQFLGISAMHFTEGMEASAMRGLEALRRGLRGPIRRLTG
jgi:hypothetical protein